MQSSLFDAPQTDVARARRGDPATAKQAAVTVPATALEQEVLSVLRTRSSGGYTTRELAAILHVDLVSVSPRMRPLVEKHLVVDSGEVRRGENGRTSIVWKATS